MSNIKVIKLKNKYNNPVYVCPYFPIGYVYISTVNINPSKYFGGTWEQIKDVFLLACGNKYSNGSKGGEATHTLTIAEMPSHNHYFGRPSWYYADYQAGGDIFTPYEHKTSKLADSYTSYTGNSQPHNNMPPYLAVYMFRKVAD